MQKNRIVHIAQAPRGVECYIEMLLNNLNKEQYENILICSQEFNLEVFRPLVKELIVVSMGREISFKDIKVTFRLIKELKRLKADVIYCHSSKAGAVGRIASLFAPGKVVYNAHGWAFNMKVSDNKQKLYRCFERMLEPFCSKIVCISNYEYKSALKNKVGTEKNLQIIFNGVEVEKIRKRVRQQRISRNELGIPDDVFVVGMIGRLSQQKAPDVFVKMAELIIKEIPSVHFLIVGDGEQRGLIDKMISNFGLQDHIHITGWVSNPNDYMALFDVGTLLSRWEGFGLVLCEYMAAGIPIVSTKIDAIPDLIQDGVNGLLVDMDDYVAAADRVIRLLLDQEIKEMLVNNASQIVESKFDIKRVVQEHENLFATLIK